MDQETAKKTDAIEKNLPDQPDSGRETRSHWLDFIRKNWRLKGALILMLLLAGMYGWKNLAVRKDVLEDPPPGVRFLAFEESGLRFELRVWSSSLMHRKGRLVSGLNFSVLERFRKHGIEMPFPQRDVHIRTKGTTDHDTPA